MKKVISLVLAVMLVFSVCIFSTSAADKTITPSATIGGQTVTMTATGVQDSFTLFDIMTIFGSSGGPYTYALWFDYGGTFSFDKDVTLSKSYFAEDFSTLGTDTKLIKAGEVVDVATGTWSDTMGTTVPWSEFSVTMDDGNSWMIVYSGDPGNYATATPTNPLSDFPGTVANYSAPAPAAPAEEAPAEEAPAAEAPAADEGGEAPAPAAPAAPAAPTTPITGKSYTVVAGDCLWTICQRIYGTGTKWGELWAANASIIENPRLIFPGQVLQIP
jgi:hypothetical protein